MCVILTRNTCKLQMAKGKFQTLRKFEGFMTKFLMELRFNSYQNSWDFWQFILKFSVEYYTDQNFKKPFLSGNSYLQTI